MKNIPYVLSGVLAVAVVILFVLVLDLRKGDQKTNSNASIEGAELLGEKLPIAYVDVDSLSANYEFAKVASEKLMSKFKTSNNSITQKQKKFEKDVADFQRKLQQNAFLSQEKAEQEQRRLQKAEQDLQQMAQRLQSELGMEEMNMYKAVADSVQACLDDYNKKAKYHVIFSNKGMDNILIADKRYDITNEIITMINARYKAGVASK